LTVTGLVDQALVLSLDDLHQLPRQTVTATLACAGNRRSEMAVIRPLPGEIPWQAGALGTAEWTGVPLRQVLQAAGVQTNARQVAFLGLDETGPGEAGRSFPFGGSIPLEKAFQLEVLLADEMNGAPIEPAHGAPLRLVVPGYIGARSVKWLSAISIQETPSDNYFFTHAYRLFPPGPSGGEPPGTPISELNLNSAIGWPPAGAQLPGGEPIDVRGYALSGGGRPIERVELTTDGGYTWQAAELAGAAQPWTWRLWRLKIKLPPGDHELAVRAWDSAAQTQPESISQVWNPKGYLNNAWHRVRFSVGSS
jgi:sulfite oxidase